MLTFTFRFPSPALAACAAGVLIGVMYTASPMTACCGLAMAVVLAWASHGLTGRERVWVLAILFLAVSLRLLALIAFFLVTRRVDGSFPILFPDEWYVARRSLGLLHLALDIPVSTSVHLEAASSFGSSGLLYVLAFAQMQLGPAPYAIRLLNMTLYLAAALILYRTVRPAFGSAAALGGLAIVLFLPSMFVWSISVLKEPICLFLTAVSVAAAATALRVNTMLKRVPAIIVCVAALLALSTVRAEAHVMVGGGILAGLLVATSIRRPVLLLIVLVFSIVLGYWAWQKPRMQEQGRDLFRTAVRTHIGHVQTPGWGYKLLDPELYAQDWATYNPPKGAMVRYVLRATASVFLVPLPWNLSSPPAVAYLPEQVMLWVLVLLAGAGSIAGVRRDAPLALMLIGITLISAVVVGMVSGNVGTLVRHRVGVLMSLAWLSSLGACTLVELVARRVRIRQYQAVHRLAGV